VVRSQPVEPGLFEPPGWHKRRHELHADRVARALQLRDDWQPTHAAALSQLRASARAVDVAEYVATSEPSAYAAQTLAQCAREWRDTLAAYGLTPRQEATGDPFADFLASIAGDDQPAPRDRPPT
jgi:hypothetical protein